MTSQEMFWLLGLLIMQGCFMTVSSEMDVEHICSSHLANIRPESNDTLAFLFNPPGGNTKFFGCQGKDVALSCCVVGAKKINWFELIFNEPQGEYIQQNNRLLENNQTLITRKSNVGSFYFKCEAHGQEGESIRNTINLTIEDCSVRKPTTFKEPLQNKTSTKIVLGEPLTLQCIIYVEPGLYCEGFCLTWYRRKIRDDGSFSNQDIDTLDHERFRQSNSLAEEPYHSFSLTFKPIEDDLRWEYFCDTFDNLDISDKSRSFILDTVSYNFIHWLALCVIITVTVIACSALMIHRYYVEIQIFYRLKIKKRPRIEDLDHHVFLLYSMESPEDRNFSLNILRPFIVETLNYRAFCETDINYGEDVLTRYGEALDNSLVLVVVFSKELIKDESCKMCIRDAIIHGRHVIFIVRENPESELESARDLFAAMRTGIRVNWLQDDDNAEAPLTCTIFCAQDLTSQPCRELTDEKHCKRQLELHLLRFLQDKSVSSCVCLQSNADMYTERYPIVSRNSDPVV